MTNASGRARFAVRRRAPRTAGERGAPRLFRRERATPGRARTRMQVERRTHVDLSFRRCGGGRLPVGIPGGRRRGPRRAPIARCAREAVRRRRQAPSRRACAATPSSGAAPLVAGEARVVLTFAMPAASEATLRLRYVPDAPGSNPAASSALTLPHAPAEPVEEAAARRWQGWWSLAWLVLARLPRRARVAGQSPIGGHPALHPEARRGAPARRSRGATAGTAGVRDAHDGFAIAGGARGHRATGFRARRGGGAGHSLTEREPSCLAPVEAEPGDVLLAEGPFTRRSRRPLPPPESSMWRSSSRKRALARPTGRVGPPARATVRRATGADAGPRRRAAAASRGGRRWADAVERAAYGERPSVRRGSAAEVGSPGPRPNPAVPSATAGRPRPTAPDLVDGARPGSL